MLRTALNVDILEKMSLSQHQFSKTGQREVKLSELRCVYSLTLTLL